MLKNKNQNKTVANNNRFALTHKTIARSGFTLIELLVVIGIIAILVGVVIAAISPGERLAEARNSQRRAHVEAIYGAIEHYVFQEKDFPGCVGDTASDVVNCEGDLVPVYMSEIPKDSVCGNGNAGYLVKKDEQNKVGVKADCAEGGEEIIAGAW